MEERRRKQKKEATRKTKERKRKEQNKRIGARGMDDLMAMVYCLG